MTIKVQVQESGKDKGVHRGDLHLNTASFFEVLQIRHMAESKGESG